MSAARPWPGSLVALGFATARGAAGGGRTHDVRSGRMRIVHVTAPACYREDHSCLCESRQGHPTITVHCTLLHRLCFYTVLMGTTSQLFCEISGSERVTTHP